MAAAWPPSPRVPSTYRPPGFTASIARASARRTGSWARAMVVPLDPEAGEHAAVVVGEGLLLEEPLLQPLLVPDREVVLQAEDAHLARHGRALAQQLRQHHATLLVHGRRLAEEVDPVEEAQLRGVGGRDLGQPPLDLQPHRHRVEADVFAG